MQNDRSLGLSPTCWTSLHHLPHLTRLVLDLHGLPQHGPQTLQPLAWSLRSLELSGCSHLRLLLSVMELTQVGCCMGGRARRLPKWTARSDRVGEQSTATCAERRASHIQQHLPVDMLHAPALSPPVLQLTRLCLRHCEGGATADAMVQVRCVVATHCLAAAPMTVAL